MMYQDRLMEISEIHAIVARVVREEPVSRDVVEAARNTVQTLCREAEEYGLTTADVVRAVLHPVFERFRGCDCWTCKARRDELEERVLQEASARVV